MGLRSTLYRLLSYGSVPDRDPDEMVELVTLRLSDGPLLVADLADHDITAMALETNNVVTRTLSDVRILVRAADLEAALAVTADHSL